MGASTALSAKGHHGASSAAWKLGRWGSFGHAAVTMPYRGKGNKLKIAGKNRIDTRNFNKPNIAHIVKHHGAFYGGAIATGVGITAVHVARNKEVAGHVFHLVKEAW